MVLNKDLRIIAIERALEPMTKDYCLGIKVADVFWEIEQDMRHNRVIDNDYYNNRLLSLIGGFLTDDCRIVGRMERNTRYVIRMCGCKIKIGYRVSGGALLPTYEIIEY